MTSWASFVVSVVMGSGIWLTCVVMGRNGKGDVRRRRAMSFEEVNQVGEVVLGPWIWSGKWKMMMMMQGL